MDAIKPQEWAGTQHPSQMSVPPFIFAGPVCFSKIYCFSNYLCQNRVKIICAKVKYTLTFIIRFQSHAIQSSLKVSKCLPSISVFNSSRTISKFLVGRQGRSFHSNFRAPPFGSQVCFYLFYFIFIVSFYLITQFITFIVVQ